MQKLLYVVVIVAGISQVVTGLAIWKPIQFYFLLYPFFGGFHRVRELAHFSWDGGDCRIPGRSCGALTARAETLRAMVRAVPVEARDHAMGGQRHEIAL